MNRVILLILGLFGSFRVIHDNEPEGSSIDITLKIVSSPKLTLKTGSSLDITLKIVSSPKFTHKTGSNLDIKSK